MRVEVETLSYTNETALPATASDARPASVGPPDRTGDGDNMEESLWG